MADQKDQNEGKKISNFRKALNTEMGKNGFIIMCLFIVITMIITRFFGDKKWCEMATFITSCFSLISGTNFCKALLAVIQGKDPDTIQ